MEKGKFIVIDGGDGSGKTTVVKAIVDRLGWNAVATREPGGSVYAESIRNLILSDIAKTTDAMTQFLMFWAARRDVIRQVIKPAVNEGKIVVCDRFDSSTYAYQVYAQDNPDLEELFWRIRKEILKDMSPDLYIHLDVPAEVGIMRAKQREERLNHFDKKKIQFHHKVNAGLKTFIGDKITNGHIIDASQPLDKVVEDTLQVVEEMLY